MIDQERPGSGPASDPAPEIFAAPPAASTWRTSGADRLRDHAQLLEAGFVLANQMQSARPGPLPPAPARSRKRGRRRLHPVEQALVPRRVPVAPSAHRGDHRPCGLGRRPRIVDPQPARAEGSAPAIRLVSSPPAGSLPRPEHAAAQHRGAVHARGHAVLPALDLEGQALDRGRDRRRSPCQESIAGDHRHGRGRRAAEAGADREIGLDAQVEPGASGSAQETRPPRRGRP